MNLKINAAQSGVKPLATVQQNMVFIAQRVEHCTADAENTGSNRVEAPKCYFRSICNCLNCYYNCDDKAALTIGMVFIALAYQLLCTALCQLLNFFGTF